MSLCHRKYPKNDFLPVHCTKMANHDGPHMNVNQLFSWYDESEEARREGERQ